MIEFQFALLRNVKKTIYMRNIKTPKSMSGALGLGPAERF